MADGNKQWYNHFGKQLVVTCIVKDKLTMQPSKLILWTDSRERKAVIHTQKNYMWVFWASLFIIHNCQKWKTFWISFNWWVNKQILFYLHHGYYPAITRNKPLYKMNDPQMLYVTWNRTDSKDYTLLDFIDMTSFWKRQNYKDRKHLNSFQELRVGEVVKFKGACGNLSWWRNSVGILIAGVTICICQIL